MCWSALLIRKVRRESVLVWEWSGEELEWLELSLLTAGWTANCFPQLLFPPRGPKMGNFTRYSLQSERKYWKYAQCLELLSVWWFRFNNISSNSIWVSKCHKVQERDRTPLMVALKSDIYCCYYHYYLAIFSKYLLNNYFNRHTVYR